MTKLYEYKEILWEFNERGYDFWVVPFCPIHKMELHNYTDSFSGICEDCDKEYRWNDLPYVIAEYLKRKIESEAYKDAEIISIDGIQTPQLKTRVKLTDENKDYWVEARVNKSVKGRQLVIYVGEKGSNQKVQLFSNVDQEKLSFDHNDRKPEEIFTEVVAVFPSGKNISISAPKDNNKKGR